MATATSRIRALESERAVLSTNWDLGSVMMKWPRKQETPGKPVSPGGRTNVLGVSLIRDANGTASTVKA